MLFYGYQTIVEFIDRMLRSGQHPEIVCCISLKRTAVQPGHFTAYAVLGFPLTVVRRVACDASFLCIMYLTNCKCDHLYPVQTHIVLSYNLSVHTFALYFLPFNVEMAMYVSPTV